MICFTNILIGEVIFLLILVRESRNSLHQKGILNNGEELNYAFGLSFGEHKGLQTVGHSGGDAGFRSYIGSYPDQDFAVAIFSNYGSVNPANLAS